MSLDNFIPTVWTAKLLDNLNDAHNYAKCVNDDYEGEIRNLGDTVKINSIGRVTVATYTKNSTSITPETLDDSQMMLAITESKYFAFEIDDVDATQQKPKLMDAAMKEAGWAMSDTVDAFLAAALEAGVASGNQLTAATSCGTGASDDDAYEILVDLDVKLSENNVPGGDRWCVVPPWFEGLLRKDPRFVSFGTDKNRGNLRGEPIGRAANMAIWLSNNVPVSSSDYTVIAGYKGACTFAEQVNKVEAFRPESAFSDAVKGLHLYGAKVTRPYALASCVCTAA